jgi:hypothetical protein
VNHSQSGEDDDRRGRREAREILLEPCDLLGADVGPRQRDVVERDEVHAAVVEGIVRLAEGVPEELAAVQARVVLAGNGLDVRDLQAAGDLLKEPHAIRVFSRVLAVVRQVAGEQDEIRTLGQAVDHVHRLLERLRAERVGRAREAHVRVGELNEGEWGLRLPVLLAEHRRDPPAALGGVQERGDLVERAKTRARCRRSS